MNEGRRAALRKKAEEGKALWPAPSLSVMDVFARNVPEGAALVSEAPMGFPAYVEEAGLWKEAECVWCLSAWGLSWGGRRARCRP